CAILARPPTATPFPYTTLFRSLCPGPPTVRVDLPGRVGWRAYSAGMAVRSTEVPAPSVPTPSAPTPSGTPDEPEGLRPVALSPSRAKDFMQCPLLLRFRAVDRLPEPPSPAATRGTLVHSVLERLYDLPAAQRVPAAGVELLGPAWDELRAQRPD